MNILKNNLVVVFSLHFSGLTPNDPRWVGAWWLGFLISSIVSTLLALVMFLFPKELPGGDNLFSFFITASQLCDNSIAIYTEIFKFIT